MEFRRPKDQMIRILEYHRTKSTSRSEDQRIRGQEDQKTKRPDDQPNDQKKSSPEDERTRKT